MDTAHHSEKHFKVGGYTFQFEEIGSLLLKRLITYKARQKNDITRLFLKLWQFSILIQRVTRNMVVLTQRIVQVVFLGVCVYGSFQLHPEHEFKNAIMKIKVEVKLGKSTTQTLSILQQASENEVMTNESYAIFRLYKCFKSGLVELELLVRPPCMA